MEESWSIRTRRVFYRNFLFHVLPGMLLYPTLYNFLAIPVSGWLAQVISFCLGSWILGLVIGVAFWRSDDQKHWPRYVWDYVLAGKFGTAILLTCLIRPLLVLTKAQKFKDKEIASMIFLIFTMVILGIIIIERAKTKLKIYRAKTENKNSVKDEVHSNSSINPEI